MSLSPSFHHPQPQPPSPTLTSLSSLPHTLHCAPAHTPLNTHTHTPPHQHTPCPQRRRQGVRRLSSTPGKTNPTGRTAPQRRRASFSRKTAANRRKPPLFPGPNPHKRRPGSCCTLSGVHYCRSRPTHMFRVAFRLNARSGLSPKLSRRKFHPGSSLFCLQLDVGWRFCVPPFGCSCTPFPPVFRCFHRFSAVFRPLSLRPRDRTSTPRLCSAAVSQQRLRVCDFPRQRDEPRTPWPPLLRAAQ